MIINHMGEAMRVEVTWGDGPDILLVDDEYGVTKYMHDLTLEQAKSLKVALEIAIHRVEELEEFVNKMMTL